MQRNFCLIIALFVLGISGCPSAESTVTNAANESLTENANLTTSELMPTSTPHKISKNIRELRSETVGFGLIRSIRRMVLTVLHGRRLFFTRSNSTRKKRLKIEL